MVRGRPAGALIDVAFGTDILSRGEAAMLLRAVVIATLFHRFRYRQI
jgi:hypothetical protein